MTTDRVTTRHRLGVARRALLLFAFLTLMAASDLMWSLSVSSHTVQAQSGWGQRAPGRRPPDRRLTREYTRDYWRNSPNTQRQGGQAGQTPQAPPQQGSTAPDDQD